MIPKLIPDIVYNINSELRGCICIVLTDNNKRKHSQDNPRAINQVCNSAKLYRKDRRFLAGLDWRAGALRHSSPDISLMIAEVRSQPQVRDAIG